MPGIPNVLGPVGTIFVEWNLMYGSCSASKKSLLFSLPSFMPLQIECGDAAAATKRHHLTHHAQSNLLGSRCAQVETGGRPHHGDFFCRKAHLAKVVQH
jgi:hypothetical protein